MNKTPLYDLVKRWKISQPLIASAIGMPLGTFKNKYLETGGKYSFSEIELILIAKVLKGMAKELEKTAGIIGAAFLSGPEEDSDLL